MRRTVSLALALAGCTVSTDYGGTDYRCDDGVCPPGFVCVGGRCQAPLPSDAAGTEDGPPGDAAVVDAPDPDGPPSPLDAAPDATPFVPPWWDTSFPHRTQMTVVNNATVELPAGFQAGFLVDVNALPDFDAIGDSDNLHVVRWDGASWTDVHRIIDDTALSDEWIWIRLPEVVAPGASEATHWMYWGNPTPPSAPSSNLAVFDFYEGFSSGTTPDADWVMNGAPSIASGVVVLDNGEDVRSTAPYGPGWAVDFTMRVPVWTSRFWGGFQVADTFAHDQPWIIFISRDSTEIWPEVRIDAAGVAPEWEGTRRPFDVDDEYFYYLDRFADRVVFRYDGEGTEEVSPTFSAPFIDPLDLRFTNDGAASMEIGFARVRRTVFPLPTNSLGSTQSFP